MREAYEIIVAPVVTEKSTDQMERSTYTFIVANDADKRAARAIVASSRQSGFVAAANCDLPVVPRAVLSHAATTLAVVCDDAKDLMQRMPDAVDAIDIDPCGSASELLPAAVRAVRAGGLLLVSSTDLGALSGRFGESAAPMAWIA